MIPATGSRGILQESTGKNPKIFRPEYCFHKITVITQNRQFSDRFVRSGNRSLACIMILIVHLDQFHQNPPFKLHVSKIYQYIDQIHHMLFKKRVIWFVLIMNKVCCSYILLIYSKIFCINIDSDSSYNQQLTNQKIDSSVSSRSINIDNSISSPIGTPTTLSSTYEVKYHLYFLKLVS